MDISAKGIEFINQLETSGRSYPRMILDSKGLPTIGVGHLIKPDEKYLLTATLSEKEINDLFHKDLKMFVDALNDALLVPVSQSKFDALVSVSFNIGKGWADGIGDEATFVKYVNARKPDKDVAKAIMRFRIPSEIIGRRAKEARLYEKGDYNMLISSSEIKEYTNA